MVKNFKDVMADCWTKHGSHATPGSFGTFTTAVVLRTCPFVILRPEMEHSWIRFVRVLFIMLDAGSTTNIQPNRMTNKLQDTYKTGYYVAIKNTWRNSARQGKACWYNGKWKNIKYETSFISYFIKPIDTGEFSKKTDKNYAARGTGVSLGDESRGWSLLSF